MGAIAIVAAAKEAWDKTMKEIRESALGATKALGQFAVGLANPDPNPAVAFEGIGAAASKAGEMIDKNFGEHLPLVGTFISVLGEATGAFGKLMTAIDDMAKRYGEYSPQIAQAEAFADIRQVMGDFRRSQEVSSNMVRYIAARSDVQQRYEDMKVKALNLMLPAVTNILERLSNMIDLAEKGIDLQLRIAENTPVLNKLLEDQLKAIRASLAKQELPPNLVDPTTAILRGFVFDPTRKDNEVGRAGFINVPNR